MINSIVKAVGTLLIVILILILTYYVTSKLGKGMMGKSASRYMKLLDRLALSQDKALALVEINEKKYLIAISASQITYLAQIDGELQPVESPQENVPHSDFRQILEQMKNGKK